MAFMKQFRLGSKWLHVALMGPLEHVANGNSLRSWLFDHQLSGPLPHVCVAGVLVQLLPGEVHGHRVEFVETPEGTKAYRHCVVEVETPRGTEVRKPDDIEVWLPSGRVITMSREKAEALARDSEAWKAMEERQAVVLPPIVVVTNKKEV